MYLTKQILLSLATTLLLISQSAQALKGDREQPVQIEADSVEINEATGNSIYKGNVEINQGSIRLLADKVTVSYEHGKAQRLVALGKPVRFRQLPDNSKQYVEGRGNKVIYVVSTEELILMNNASLQQGKDSFKSDRIVYDRHLSKLKAGAAANGKQRVKVTISPRKLP